MDTSPSDEVHSNNSLNVAKARSQLAAAASAAAAQSQTQAQQQAASTPIYASFTNHNNGSTNSLQNFSRPTISTAVSAARSVAGLHSPSDIHRAGGHSPLTLHPHNVAFDIDFLGQGHFALAEAFAKRRHVRAHPTIDEHVESIVAHRHGAAVAKAQSDSSP
jgi:hypothetical protein